MVAVDSTFWVVAMLVLLALVFDFMNGFHDAANSIATVVSTGVLKPQQAILFAAFFNVVAILVFELKVAGTIGKGIVLPDVVDHHVVFGALIGAIFWNVVTWWYGIPSSSSHARQTASRLPTSTTCTPSRRTIAKCCSGPCS